MLEAMVKMAHADWGWLLFCGGVLADLALLQARVFWVVRYTHGFGLAWGDFRVQNRVDGGCHDPK